MNATEYMPARARQLRQLRFIGKVDYLACYTGQVSERRGDKLPWSVLSVITYHPTRSSNPRVTRPRFQREVATYTVQYTALQWPGFTNDLCPGIGYRYTRYRYQGMAGREASEAERPVCAFQLLRMSKLCLRNCAIAQRTRTFAHAQMSAKLSFL